MAASKLRRILCVDDDPDLRNIITMSLQHVGGYIVQGCESGEEAVENAPTFDPQLILLDVMMPEMDGPETLAAFRRDPRLADTVVVFISAKARSGDKASLMSLGALDVIAKPFDPMHLHEQIDAIWRRYCDSAEDSVEVR